MMRPRWGSVLRRVQSLLDDGMLLSLSDADLLERYASGDRESAERAFAALVERHGPMVSRVCRSLLLDEHAAADAFQATFLVLARKAGSLWVQDSIGPWLHGVAYRTSSCARNAAARRRFHERKSGELSRTHMNATEPDEVGPVLHQEVDRLPERYRAPIVLCYFEGMTHEQAAERLHCPVGTVRSRLATGREHLRRRLTLRGIAPERSDAEAAVADKESAVLLPAGLVESAVRNAMVHAGASAAGVVPAAVASLAEKGMRTMMLARLRTLALALVVVGGGTVGVFTLAQTAKMRVKPDQAQPPAAVPAAVPQSSRPIVMARIETAREILNRDLERIQIDPANFDWLFDQIPLWSRRLMEDRLRLAASREERLDAIREHRNRMIERERSTRKLTESERIQPSAVLKMRYYRLEADQLLADEGVDLEKEAPAAESDKAKVTPPPNPPAPKPGPRR
jgi:RNA polymerase sigma factor (sigma-70 family)